MNIGWVLAAFFSGLIHAGLLAFVGVDLTMAALLSFGIFLLTIVFYYLLVLCHYLFTGGDEC
jgi:hypothetical protein